MQNNDETKPSFWSTLPGMITALGGIIGAAAALITALYAAGVIGSRTKPPDNLSPISSPTAESQSNSTNKAEETARAEASRSFVTGRWRVEHEFGETSGGTLSDFQPDGTFAGSTTMFVGGRGEKQLIAGRWDFEKLSKDTFRITVRFENQTTWLGTFRIIDQDHIHNINENYIAVRSK